MFKLKAAMFKLNLKLMLSAYLLVVSTMLHAEGEDCDITLGEKIFKKCAVCHTHDDSGSHLVGPNLHGVIDRMSGSTAEFAYSIALQDAPRKWTPEALDEFLEKPMSILPGTSMAFAGIRKPHQRAAVICYMNGGETP